MLLAASDADLIMDLSDIRNLMLKTQASILENGFLGFNDVKPSGSACSEVGLRLGFGFAADFCETSVERAKLESQ